MKRIRGLQPDVPPLAPLPPRAEPLSRGWRVVAAMILLFSVCMSAGHIYSTPVLAPEQGSLINAPDEPAHRGYVEVMRDAGRLPRKDDPTYEWHQPPLYYALIAPFNGWGPLAGRWLTLMMGLVSLGLIFLTARRLFPSDPPLAVLAMGLAALIPMRQAVYSAIGNDALLELTCSAFLFALVPAFTHGFTVRRSAVLGVVLGAAFLTKVNGLLLVPVAGLALYLLYRQSGEGGRSIAAGAATMFGLALLTFLPVGVRNVQLYGEPIPLRAFREEFAHTQTAVNWIGAPLTDELWTGEIHSGEPMTRLGYLRLVANWTARTFFAAYTRPNRASLGVPSFPQPPVFYVPFALIALAAAAGLLRLHLRRKSEFTPIQLAFIWMMFTTIGLVALAFAGFVWTYFQAQGRYLYPAMLPLAVLGALGLRAIVPASRRDAVALGVLGIMALLSFAFLFVYVQPTYAPAAASATVQP